MSSGSYFYKNTKVRRVQHEDQNMTKSIVPELAVSRGRRDEKPNIELAEKLARTRNDSAVAELIGLLETGTSQQQADALKTLYEIGERAPEMIAPYAKAFISLLEQKN